MPAHYRHSVRLSTFPIAKTIKSIHISALQHPISCYRNCSRVLTAETEITPKLLRLYPGMLPPLSGHRGTRYSLGEARRDPVVWISVFAHRYRGEDQKEDLRLEIQVFVIVFPLNSGVKTKKNWSWSRKLSLCHDVHSCFRSRTKLYSRLWLWGTVPEMHPVALSLLLSFGAQSCL